MGETNLREEQEPPKNEYEENPEATQITLTATGAEQADARACSVDIGRAIYEAELHEGAVRELRPALSTSSSARSRPVPS